MSKKKKTIIIVALLLVVFIGSISYALWSVTLEQTGSNVVKTGCFTVNMQEESPAIELAEAYPIKDSEGWDYDPFTFTIQNTCNIDSSYSVNLEVGLDTTLDEGSVKTVLDGNTPKVLTEYLSVAHDKDIKSKYQLTTGTLAGASTEGGTDGESVTYNLRLWLDENTSEDEMSKDFYAKIVVENITTSGVEAREVLATADISEAGDGSVSYTYYSTGEVEINGTGRMALAEGQTLATTIISQMIGEEEFTSTLTAEESAILNSETGQLALTPVVQNYRFLTRLAGVTCSTEPTDYDSFKTCLQSAGLTDSNLYSLMDKVKAYIPAITKVTIAEGITNIADDCFNALKLDELKLPSTIVELGKSSFYGTDIDNLELNEGITTLGYKVFAYSYTDVVLPNTVTTIGSGIIDFASNMTLLLPKNEQFTSLITYLFENATNATIIVPDTITSGFNTSNFAQAENITLNFECSEENAPSGVAELVSNGSVVAVNYNYQIES